MKTRIFKNLLLMVAWISLASNLTLAQFVGIGEASPGSKLDVVSNVAAGNSIEVNHNNAFNGSSAIWIRNNGFGRALNVNSLHNGNNVPALAVTQAGTGATSRGIEVTMPNGTAAFGAGIFHDGNGDALFLNPNGNGWGIFNQVTGNGNGIYNLIGASSLIGSMNDLSSAGGIGTYQFFNGRSGSAMVVDSMNNGWGIIANVNTTTPNAGNLVFGGIIGAEQFGVGTGALINHYGTDGRCVEFNVLNPNNTEPALFATSDGRGNVMVVQNQNNNIPGTISVGDFAYTGSDVGDHIAIAGQSTPAPGWGVGVEGTGNWYGVLARGNLGATGTKTFVIDHPQDPGNRLLRHFSMESDEVLNVYRGMVEVDASGQATVELPDYFQDINTEFSYQLTPVGSSVTPYVAQEISNNNFVVAGAPNSKISWMVLAQRNDLYLQQNPDERLAEVNKKTSQQGLYMQPELYGQPASLRIGSATSGQARSTSQPYRDPSHKQAALQAHQRAHSQSQGRTESELEVENDPQ